MARVDDNTYLLAAHGDSTYSTPLKLQSINVENALSCTGAAAPTSEGLLAGNKLLDYVHSCCLRFPLDDSVSLHLAEAAQLAGKPQDCRVVNLVHLNSTL